MVGSQQLFIPRKFTFWNSDENIISWVPGNIYKNPKFLVEKKNGSGFTGPRPKNHGKMDTSTNIW